MNRVQFSRPYTRLFKIYQKLKLFATNEEHSKVDTKTNTLLKFIPGKNLREIDKSRFTSSDLASIEIAIANKLKEQHKLGIIHRDLKPENIILNTLNEPTIIDYDLSVEINATKEKCIGNPQYMAPEAALTKYDERVDIFSFGLIVFYIETGRDPYYTTTDIPVCEQLDFGLIHPISLPFIIDCLTRVNPEERISLDQFIFFRTFEDLNYCVNIDKIEYSIEENRITINNKDNFSLSALSPMSENCGKGWAFSFDDLFQMFQEGYAFTYVFNKMLKKAVAMDYNERFLIDTKFIFQGYILINFPGSYDYFLLDNDIYYDFWYSLIRYQGDHSAIDLHQSLINIMEGSSFPSHYYAYKIEREYGCYLFGHLLYVVDEYPSFLEKYGFGITNFPISNIDFFRRMELILRSYQNNTLLEIPFYLLLLYHCIRNELLTVNEGESRIDYFHLSWVFLKQDFDFYYKKGNFTFTNQIKPMLIFGSINVDEIALDWEDIGFTFTRLFDDIYFF